MNKLIQKEIDSGISPNHIVLCGFSQGAGVAFWSGSIRVIESNIGLTRDSPIGAVISLCGCLPNDRQFVVNPNVKSTYTLYSVFHLLYNRMFHGTADTHVPYDFMQKLSQKLREEGMDHVEFNGYPGVKHKITRRMMDITRSYLEELTGCQ